MHELTQRCAKYKPRRNPPITLFRMPSVCLLVEKVPYEELDMTVEAIEADRRRRGEEPLAP